MPVSSLAAPLADRLDLALTKHLPPLPRQMLTTPLTALRRIATVRAARLMDRLDGNLTLRRTMFFGGPMRFPFPACWDLQVYGTYIDEAELRLERHMIRDLPPGGTMIDVGANVGFFSLLAARVLGPGGRVLAVEPGTAALRYLRANLADAPGAEIIPRALVARGDSVTFYEGGGAAMVSSSTQKSHMTDRQAATRIREVTVPATTLDALVAETGCRPDLIKLDVEGGELAVLQGGAQVLERDRPDVVMEVAFDEYDRGYADCCALLLAAGYRPFTLGPDGAARPLDPTGIQAHGNTCTLEMGFLHGLDNILFRHPARHSPA